MRKINSRVLQEVRETKGLSHATLADASRINVKTIKRIESGKFPRNRDNVIKSLARALGISESELTSPQYSPSKPRKLQQTNNSANADKSEMEPKNENDELNDIFRQSQLNARVSDRARNALSLAAARYKVSLSQIVEIAPLLFCWAAEKSLEQRQQVIDNIKQKNDELASFQQSHLHPTGFMFHNRSEAIFDSEQKSINLNDIFGKLIDRDGYESYLPDDYDEAKNNPFSAYLRKLTESLKDATALEGCEIFEEWDPDDSPNYSVCQSTALSYVANDNEAAECILEGSVPLHKIPKELKEKNKGEERAKWIREEAAARFPKIDLELHL